MEELLPFLDDVRTWHWWALAAMLVALEMLSPTFYFLWPGIAAAIVGLILVAVPNLSPDAQIFTFAVLAVASTVAWKRFAPASWISNEPVGTLNQRAAQYAGRRVKVTGDFQGGRGAILLDDTRWSAVTSDGSNPINGDTVEIIGADGALLRVTRSIN